MRLLKDLALKIENKVNLFNVKIRIIYLELLITKGFHDIGITNKINQLVSEIKKTDINESIKHILYINLVSLLYEINISLVMREITHFRIKESVLGNISLEERIKQAKFISELIEIPLSLIAETHKFALDTEDNLLTALCLYRESYFFFSFEFYITILSVEDDNAKKVDKPIKSYRNNINKAIQSYNILTEKNLYRKAYDALTLSLELYKLYLQRYDDEINKYYVKEKILKTITSLEKELNIESYESLVDKFFKEGLPALTKEYTFFLDLSEEEISSFADTIVRSFNVPDDRKKNIILDIKNSQKFEKQVNRKYFNLLQNLTHTKKRETIYKSVPRYVIECKKCSYRTDESDNIDELIKQLKNEHSHYCF